MCKRNRGRQKRRCERSRWSHQSISHLSFCEQNSSSRLEQEYGMQRRSGRHVSLQRLQWRRRQSLSCRLLSHNVPEVCSLAKRLSIKLSGVSRKADIVERIICMAEFGCIRRTDETATPDLTGLTYLAKDVRTKLQHLPGFSTVTDWSKNRRGVLVEFTFMNLLLYLVYGRDKTFGMQSMRAFKSLKAYRFFSNGFVSNVWLHDCMTSGPRIVYVCTWLRATLSH